MKRLRAYSIELILVAVLILAVAFFGHLGYGLVDPVGAEDLELENQALEYATTQVAAGARVVGTEPNTFTGNWLVDELKTMGWNVYIQPFLLTPPSSASAIPASARDENGNITARNIIAVRGEDESLPAALLVTHFDTRSAADADPDQARRLLPVPGANGGASGTGTLLELARTLDVAATGHTVCLVFLDAEDNRGLQGWAGPFGSDFFLEGVARNIQECSEPRLAVVVDFAGSINQRFLIDQNSDAALSAAIWGVADELGFSEWFVRQERPAVGGVHDTLARMGVPATALIDADYPFIHATADTIDKLSSVSLERVTETLKTWLERGAPFEGG